MFLLQAKDSVTGAMFFWTSSAKTGAGYPGPNAATELAIVAERPIVTPDDIADISGAYTVNAGSGLTGGGAIGTDPTLAVQWSTGAPPAVAAASAIGAVARAAREDHTHSHGPQAGGSLHALATSGAAGFVPAVANNGIAARVGGAALASLAPDANQVLAGDASGVLGFRSVSEAMLSAGYSRKFATLAGGATLALENTDWPTSGADGELIVYCNSSGAGTLTLPPSPTIGMVLTIVTPHAGTAPYTVTIDPNGQAIERDERKTQTVPLTINLRLYRWVCSWQFLGSFWYLITPLPLRLPQGSGGDLTASGFTFEQSFRFSTGGAGTINLNVISWADLFVRLGSPASGFAAVQLDIAALGTWANGSGVAESAKLTASGRITLSGSAITAAVGAIDGSNGSASLIAKLAVDYSTLSQLRVNLSPGTANTWVWHIGVTVRGTHFA